MSPSFLVTILNCTQKPFTSSMTSSVYARVGKFLIRQRPQWTYTDDAILLVKGLYVQFRILTMYDGDINLIR